MEIRLHVILPELLKLILPSPSNNPAIKLEFPKINEKYYSYFIAGLFDGDGSISFKSSGKITCNLISTKEVLNFIQTYLNDSFEISPKSLIQVSENCSNVFKVYWQSNEDCLKFLDYIYQGNKDIYLTRKYERYQQFKSSDSQE